MVMVSTIMDYSFSEIGFELFIKLVNIISKSKVLVPVPLPGPGPQLFSLIFAATGIHLTSSRLAY
jgi:hypothetical protein